MTTPIETVADALIAFILSLLREPGAAEEFNDDPDAAIAARGLQGACAADVRSVAPIIADHPSVGLRQSSSNPHSHAPVGSDDPGDDPDGTPFGTDPQVIREISRIINQFTTVDARSTIVDQSTNQNIWTQGGDLTQIFDQSAVVAAGDGSMAAGDDVLIDGSETTIDVGDVAVGNTSGSHNTTTTGDADEAAAPADADDAAEADAAASALTDPALDAGLSQVADAVDTAADAAAATVAEDPAAADPAPAEEGAPLLADMTDSAGVDAAEPLTPPEPEAYPEEPIEDQ